ncbi:MAG: CSLREA domain-containing protein, partial [Armatimonadetes bacterium]
MDGDGNGTSLCDIGAYEAKPADSAQTSPYIINVSSNTDDGVCTQANCSLREAVNAANAHPNGSTPDEIRFNIPISGVQTI